MALTLLFPIILACARDDLRIEVTLRDQPGDGSGKRPLLVCDGTTNLPDRSRIDLSLYFDQTRPCELIRNAVEVKGGTFSYEFDYFGPPRNMAGPYLIRATFDPFLQKQQILEMLDDRARKIHAEGRLHVGTPLDAEQDRRHWYGTLLREIRSVTDFARQADARYYRDKNAGRFDPREWQRSYAEAAESSLQTFRRVVGVPHYKALGLNSVTNEGMEELRGLVLHFITQCLAVLSHPNDPQGANVLREGRIHLDRTEQRLTEMLSPSRVDVKLLKGLVEDARRILREATTADGEGRARAQALFRAAVISIDRSVPKTFHEAIVRLAGDAVPLFEAPDADRQKAVRLQEALDRQLQDLLREIQEMK